MEYLTFLEPIYKIFKGGYFWFKTKWPIYKVLGHISDNDKKVRIFVRDFFIRNGTNLYSREGLNGPIGIVPNVLELWPSVEGKGLGNLFYVLGQVGKKDQVEIVEMGKDSGLWDSNLMVLGAQTQKCFDFYKKMEHVAYEIDDKNIYEISTKKIIKKESGYGYGIILKCQNPFVENHKGIAFLLGGYGTLGTEVASYYFMRNISLLGKKFGKNYFGVIVRASIFAGVQSVERLEKYDIMIKN